MVIITNYELNAWDTKRRKTGQRRRLQGGKLPKQIHNSLLAEVTRIFGNATAGRDFQTESLDVLMVPMQSMNYINWATTSTILPTYQSLWTCIVPAWFLYRGIRLSPAMHHTKSTSRFLCRLSHTPDIWISNFFPDLSCCVLPCLLSTVTHSGRLGNLIVFLVV